VLGHGDDKFKNTAIGAAVGAAVGGAVEANGEMKAQDQARDEAQQRADDMKRTKAEKAMRRANYRRALTACLEGRGYTVR
jgi:pyruvoyl-dependent arginine decarboxylase (PvlArgDC)